MCRIKDSNAKDRLWITLISILFGILGISELLHSIRISRVEKDTLVSSISTDVSANKVKWARYSERRQFNEGLFPRNALDSLEADYENYADWTELHEDYLDSLMSLREPVEMNLIGKPELHSSLSDELNDICEKYLHEIDNYNNHAKEFNKLEIKSENISRRHLQAEIASAGFLFLSFILQVVLAFCTFNKDRKQENSSEKSDP